MNDDPARYLDAQVGVLGSVLISGELAGTVVSRTRAEDYEGKYRAIYTAIAEAFAEGRPADPIIVLDKLGSEYRPLLLEMMDLTPTAANVETYISVLQEQARLRRIRPLAEAIPAAPNLEAVRELVAKINLQLCERPKIQGMNFEEGLLDFFDRHEGDKKYIPWGFEKLDEQLYAEPGDFIVLGGYPSSGKTALALNFAMRQSAAYRVGMFSLETGKGKLFDRMIASVAKVNMEKIKRNKLEENDYEAIVIIGERHKKTSIEMFSAAGMTVQDIQAIAVGRRFDLVYIDYLQLITSHGRSRVEEVSNISMDLHRMAQANGIAVVALSQLNRPEKSGDYNKAPGMQSLRESGQIEQDADIIMLLYKTEPDNPSSPRVLKIAKNKEGIVGKITLNFDGPTQTFREGFAPPPKKQPEPENKQIRFEELTGEDRKDLPF